VAAPTNVRVESTSITTTVLNWTSGSGNTSIWRSTDGVSYSVLTSLLPATTTYTDTGLASGTKYWYKLSDDDGSTFSSVVTVYTQGCPTPSSADQQLGLPDDDLQALARRVEELFQDKVVDPSKCLVCADDGRLIFDCSRGCSSFEALVDEDVNSITFENCPDNVDADLLIPPNVTRKICGFPRGFGFTGDECFQAPIVAGPNGATMSIGKDGGSKSKPGVGRTTNSGGGGGGSACTCVPGRNNALTIKSCNANNSLNCTGGKSLRLLACGGKGPYTWSKTGSVTLTGPQAEATAGSTAEGSTVTVRPPTNSGSAVAGNAYTLYYLYCQQQGSGAGVCAGVKFNVFDWRKYGCNDVATTSCTGNTVDGTGCAVSPTSPCKAGDCDSNCTSGNCSGLQAFRGADTPCAHDANLSGGGMCDTRSAGMISNGCNPCGLQAGSTVTVTDALGVSVTITLKA
jgi:hypothetical protein